MNSGSSLLCSIWSGSPSSSPSARRAASPPCSIPCASRAICWPSGQHQPSSPPSPPQIENQIAGLVAPDFVRHKVFGNKELIARWRQRANHDCFCPAQPGLERLHGFCLTQGFATQDEGGIRMARRFANLLSMRLAREWALANEGPSSRITTTWTGCFTCSNPATTTGAARIASTSRSRCKCPLTSPRSPLRS